MKIKTIKTHRIKKGDNLFQVLDKYIKKIEENTVVAITSKIVSICEREIIPIDQADKKDLIAAQSEYYIPKQKNKYNVTLTIKRNILSAAAGLDESNGNGFYILWPKSPQKSANKIRNYLIKRYNLKNLGVIITDSKSTPLRWGTTGITLAHSGFKALKDYIGTPDIFGRYLQMTKSNIADGLAAAAVVVMGEGNEQTPLAIITDVPFVEFQTKNPSKKDLQELAITLEDDIYKPILKPAPWKRGGSTRN